MNGALSVVETVALNPACPNIVSSSPARPKLSRLPGLKGSIPVSLPWRAAVDAMGLEVLCAKPEDRSPVLTAVMMPEGHSADRFRAVALRNYDMSLGNGLSKVADRVFRIGHLGDFNDLMLIGTLAGVEMGLRDAGVPHRQGGVQAAMEVLGQKFASARAAA